MTILIFLAVLVMLILVHEFGHFFVAKKSGIRVDEFGIGFPPKIIGKKIGETEYTINWLPLGGFVSIWGENPTDENYTDSGDNSRSFVQQPKYIQAAVLVAGVTMNILFAFVLYVIAFMIGMPTAIESFETAGNIHGVRLVVTSILPESPALDQLLPNDEIVALRTENGSLSSSEQLTPKEVSEFISSSNGAEVTFEVKRQNDSHTLTLQPLQGIFKDDPSRYGAGFTMSLVGIQNLPIHLAIVEGAKQTYTAFIDITIGLYGFFTGIVTGSSNFSDVTGPVGIVGLVGDAAAMGIVWLISFSAFISLNLAVINLLPFPALDGGRLVLVGIEAITRKPINPMIATRLNQVGFIALLTLMAIVTFNDVVKLF